jgi:hypothetical protein
MAVPIAVAATPAAIVVPAAVMTASGGGDLAPALAQLAPIFAPGIGATQLALALALFLADFTIVSAPILSAGRSGRKNDGAKRGREH